MTSCPPVQLLDRHRSPAQFEQVCKLGRRYKKTLGFLPLGGFAEYADKNGILIHQTVEGTVNGYVLFRRIGTPHQVRITHLCVAEEARRQGVATQLIQHLTEVTQHALGIGLHCRSDYDANHMWPLLDFRPRRRKTGRGKNEAELIFWWRDHGHPTLFSSEVEYVESTVIRAVLDANVVFDLIDSRRPYHEEATGLMVDWLRPLVEYSISPELSLEILRQPDPTIQRKSQQAAETYLQIPVNTDQLKTLATSIRARLGWIESDNNCGDTQHLAYTALSGCRYFITRDETILASAPILEDEFGVIAMLPRQFAMQSYELQREDQYRPVGVGDTQFRRRRLAQEDAHQLYNIFRNELIAERKKDFEQRVAARLAHPDQHYNTLYEDQAGKPLLFTSTGTLPDEFQMEFFRTVRHPLTSQLARYALNQLVAQATQENRWIVTCTDNPLDQQASVALSSAGFMDVPKHGLLKLAPPLIGSPSEVVANLRAHPWLTAELRAHAEHLAFSIEKATEQPKEWLPQVEHVLWPTKILHPELGNFIIPIQPTWARRLFDEGIAGLYSGRDHEQLLLNWENVYYSMSKRQALMRPGSHILWYVSSESGYNVSAIRACSTVEEVRGGTARELHSQFKRLGVYRLRDLHQLAGDREGPMLAIRFTRTELFRNPISLKQYREQRMSLGLGQPPIYGPTHISDVEFKTLYVLGHGRA